MSRLTSPPPLDELARVVDVPPSLGNTLEARDLIEALADERDRLERPAC